MLYVFHGGDTKKSIDRARLLIDSLRNKRPDASFVRVDADNWSVSIVEEHIGGQGLFSNKYIIFLDRVTENVEAKEKIVELVPTMNDSANIFIVLEGRLNVELAKAFAKSAEKVVISEQATMRNRFDHDKSVVNYDKKDFNIFALADAFGVRDSMKAWGIYRQAIEKGIEVESIAGTLFWQIKSMIIARNAKSASEAGLSPFVFSKSKRHASNYSMDELRKLIENLVVVYHDGHRGVVNMELEIERTLLSI
jgi:DNA polymerase III delta subunit